MTAMDNEADRIHRFGSAFFDTSTKKGLVFVFVFLLKNL